MAAAEAAVLDGRGRLTFVVSWSRLEKADTGKTSGSDGKCLMLIYLIGNKQMGNTGGV